MKELRKIATAKFKVSNPDLPNSELLLDFNPIVNHFNLNLSGRDYQLIHWQGRPKGDRQWGIYDSKTDSYRTGIYDDYRQFAYGGLKLLMLDDRSTDTLPSAVLMFFGSGLPS
jgi:hypothetical protein